MIGALPLLLLALQAPPPAAAETPSASPPAAAPPSGAPGAPTDDYGFVAWCRGALQGHMDLYAQVRPEMARVQADKLAAQTAGKPAAEADRLKAALAKEAERDAELDAQQLAAGRDYIGLYNRALQAAEEAGAPRIRGTEMTAQGYRVWAAARAADGKTRMYSYLMWELPGRCETAAKSLEERSGLFAEAFKRAGAEPADAPKAEEPSPDASAAAASAPQPPAPGA